MESKNFEELLKVLSIINSPKNSNENNYERSYEYSISLQTMSCISTMETSSCTPTSFTTIWCEIKKMKFSSKIWINRKALLKSIIWEYLKELSMISKTFTKCKIEIKLLSPYLMKSLKSLWEKKTITKDFNMKSKNMISTLLITSNT